MHICQDEIMAIAAIIPGITWVRHWFRTVWKRRHSKPNCTHAKECAR